MNIRSNEVVIVLDGKFGWRDGTALSGHMSFQSFANKYIEAGADRVLIAGRAYDELNTSNMLPVEGPGAGFVRLASYRGAVQFLQQLPRLIHKLWKMTGHSGHILLYLPGIMPSIAWMMCLLRCRSFATFLVADPADQMSPESLRHRLQPIAMRCIVAVTKSACWNGLASLYVTQRYLQTVYPNKSSSAQFSASDVNLPNGSIVSNPKFYGAGRQAFKLVYLAAMLQAYKGHDLLIDAFSRVAHRYPGLQLELVGGGSLQGALQQRAEGLGFRDRITFHGQVQDRNRIQEILDSSDIYISPSRAEGMPRAVIEAMARGLPIIGTNVGGMQEIAAADQLCKPNSVSELAVLIEHWVSNSLRLTELSRQSLERCSAYQSDSTRQARKAFINKLLGRE